jgi:hypothetical protein
MSRDLLDLAASAKRVADSMEGTQTRAVHKAALHTVRLVRAEIRAATGDMRLSGVGRKGARVGAKYDVMGTRNPTALIKATGPMQLIERNTSPHGIQPRGYRVSKRWLNAVAKGKLAADSDPVYLGGGKALKFGGGFYRRAMHPGTRGQHPFRRGVDRAAPDTPRIFQREIRALVAREWVR